MTKMGVLNHPYAPSARKSTRQTRFHITGAFTVVITVMVILSMAMSADVAQPGGSGDVTVRYHPGIPDGTEQSLDITYNGIVSTEYNPQFWEGTIKGDIGDDIVVSNWNPISSYDEGETRVFNGWAYATNGPSAESESELEFSTDVVNGHYNLPGDVITGDDLTNATAKFDGKVHVKAMWETLHDVKYVDGSHNNRDDGDDERTATTLENALNGNGKRVRAISTIDDNPFRSIIIMSDETEYDGSVYKSVTIRGDGESILNIGDESMTLGAEAIIDNLVLKGTGSSHGNTAKGILANGNPLVIGTGVDSRTDNSDYTAGNTPQVFGGSGGGPAPLDTPDHTQR